MLIPKKVLEELVDLRNNLEDENYELKISLKKEKVRNEYLYKNLGDRVSIIREKEELIEKIQKENIKLKEKNQIFENLYGKPTPKWNIDIDIAWRINLLTNEQEQHSIPKNINIDKVQDVILSNDLKWVSFKYDDEKYKNKEFKIPRSLGEQLKIITPLNNKNQDKIDINEIKDIEDIKNILDSRGINTNLEYWQSSIEYLIFCRGVKFKTIEFKKACKFKNRESARKYINKLIETGLIKRVRKGAYEVLFNFE